MALFNYQRNNVWAFGLVLAAGQVRALEPADVFVYSAGPVLFRPKLVVAETYHDNIYYSESDSTADLITALMPSLNVQLGEETRNYIVLDYALNQMLYANNSSANGETHRLRLHQDLHWSKINWNGSMSYERLTTVFESKESSFLRSSVNLERSLANLEQTIDYDVGDKTGVYLTGRFDQIDYQKDSLWWDLNRTTGILGARYDVSAKTRIFGEFFYGQTATSPNISSLNKGPWSQVFGGFAGVRGNFTQKFSGQIKLGYEQREFSDDSPAPSDPIVDVSLTYRITPKNSTSLSYSRGTYVSEQNPASAFTYDRIALNLVQFFGAQGNFFGALNAQLMQYAYDSFGGVDRTDLRSSLRCGLYYQPEDWLVTGLEYSFSKISSDFDRIIQYDANQITLSVAVGY